MKKVIITIDTEGHDGKDPISKLIWGKTEQGLFGIDRIMDICDMFNAKSLFFVDMAEAWDYGKDKITDVINHIIERGHEVGVHIHPDHMADNNRLFLWEYTREEQFNIIKKCTDLYIEITGKHPYSFRAGKYGANLDTLDILNELDYKYDFSQFYGQKWCGIESPVAYVLPQKYKNLVEFPVTAFKSFQFGKHSRYDKVDAVMDPSEYKYIMNQIAKDTNNVVVSLFYHSFSMLKWREDPDNPTFDPKEEKKFINALEFVYKSKDFHFTSLEELSETVTTMNLERLDSKENIPETKGLLRQSWYFLKRIYNIRKINKKAKIAIYGLIGVIILLIMLLVSLIVFI